MVNPEKLEKLIRSLRRYTGYLRQLAQEPAEEFVNDPLRIGSAKYYLQVSIECCLDIANHIIASEQFRPPQDYRDSFKVLHEQGIIPDDFTTTLQDMTSFRNRLVHLYSEVEDRQIYRVLTSELGDFDRFLEYVLDFTSSGSQEPLP